LLSRLGDRGSHPGAAAPRRIPLADWHPTSHPALLSVLTLWGAELLECGAIGRDDQGEPLYNQCFYLSLAAATSPDHGAIASTAFTYKRRMEAAVLLSRGPNYPLQAEAGAFADFLEDGVSSIAALHNRAVAVADAVTGGVTLYSAPAVLDTSSTVILLWHTPGHYQLIRWCPPVGQPMARPGPFGQSLSHPPGSEVGVTHFLVEVRPPALLDIL